MYENSTTTAELTMPVVILERGEEYFLFGQP
jgi:hypothetical protein